MLIIKISEFLLENKIQKKKQKDFQMKIKNVEIVELDHDEEFYDISTSTGNFVISDSKIVVHNSHIASLIITALLKVVPKLFHYRKVYRAQMPLYGVKDFNGKFLPFWSEEDMMKFKQEHPKIQITRYKGLGEMNPPELAGCLLNPETRRLEEIPDWSDLEIEEIFKMMTDAETKREMLNDDSQEGENQE